MDHGLVQVFRTARLVGYDKPLHWPFIRRKGCRYVIGLMVHWHEAHAARGDRNEGRHGAMTSDGGSLSLSVVPNRDYKNYQVLACPPVHIPGWQCRS